MNASWSDIIRAAATGDLGLLALIVLILGTLALVFFRKGPLFAQMFVFLVMFGAAVIFGSAVVEQRKNRDFARIAEAQRKSATQQPVKDRKSKESKVIEQARPADKQHVLPKAVQENVVPPPPERADIFIATGPATGVYFPLGSGMAAVLRRHVPGFNATVGSSNGSTANLLLIEQRKADIAFTMADVSWDAFKGQRKFRDRQIPLRALMVLFPNRMHVVTMDGTGIRRMQDLKGKRVSTGAPNSATELMAYRVLEAYGINAQKDIVRERLGPGNSAQALKDRKIDAFFWLGSVPTSSVSALATAPGVRIRMIDHDEAVERMVKKYGPFYLRDVMPAQSYPGQDQPTRIAMVWNVLVARADLSDNVAYYTVKTMLERKEEMLRVHRDAQHFDLKYQSNAAAAIPYHPGALKYFAEKGLDIR